MASTLTTVAFDADDTLWHNERFFQLTQAHFADLLRDYTDRDSLMEELLAAEKRNLGHYGFGVKGFTLSMIETALEVTQGRVPGTVITEILDAGRDMLRHPIELLPHAKAALENARQNHRILLITKGDLLDQERKLAQSGIGEFFDAVEIVSEKARPVYEEIFARHGDGVEHSLMVGNSLKSDILPVLSAGGWAVHVPYEVTWELEAAKDPVDAEKFRKLVDLAGLAPLLHEIA
ncbi:MAG: HAD family hydrolase [Pseudomonadota bacterium]